MRAARKALILHRMTDRLRELQRQRELLRQHADWLEREIAAEAARSGSPAQTVVPAPAPSPAPAATPPQTAATPSAEEILRQYTRDPHTSSAEVKRGCWAIFAGGLALLVLVVVTWYVARGR